MGQLKYTAEDIAAAFQQYADHIANKIAEINNISTLPVTVLGVNARAYKVELLARQRAAEILVPVQQMFALAAREHMGEAILENSDRIEAQYEQLPMPFAEWSEDGYGD
jgi:hypothetical protein